MKESREGDQPRPPKPYPQTKMFTASFYRQRFIDALVDQAFDSFEGNFAEGLAEARVFEHQLENISDAGLFLVAVDKLGPDRIQQLWITDEELEIREAAAAQDRRDYYAAQQIF